jgi:uncharacterized damage-inducible protein DinB
MTAANPYGEDLGARAPLEALADTPGRIRQLVDGWSDADFERSYAPGKWSIRQVLIHLAQTELALTTRARFALSQSDYAAQAFSQDDWMHVDHRAPARTALDAYLALRQFNLAMWRGLTADQLARQFTHPEYGTLTVGWILAQMAGHDIHHYTQVQRVK